MKIERKREAAVRAKEGIREIAECNDGKGKDNNDFGKTKEPAQRSGKYWEGEDLYKATDKRSTTGVLALCGSCHLPLFSSVAARMCSCLPSGLHYGLFWQTTTSSGVETHAMYREGNKCYECTATTKGAEVEMDLVMSEVRIRFRPQEE
jgi:hypothetical protein